MNIFFKSVLFSLTSFILIGCIEKNQKDITVSGSITDNLSGQPIENAKVTVLCWYDAGWEKLDYESQDLMTDPNGLYEVTFKEGYKVIVASVAPEHKKVMYQLNTLSDSRIKVDLELPRDSISKNTAVINLKDYILSDVNSW
ncbi:hypothetical protein [Nibribacter koreensis]|uniref:Carboxypeptidase regulatory-like domain-containing protein n=1 Tax=Nibribacter koreensis TaxID=1084519 RepID=A0ABP8FSP1_9BACT